jgi:hypothetical protein
VRECLTEHFSDLAFEHFIKGAETHMKRDMPKDVKLCYSLFVEMTGRDMGRQVNESMVLFVRLSVIRLNLAIKLPKIRQPQLTFPFFPLSLPNGNSGPQVLRDTERTNFAPSIVKAPGEMVLTNTDPTPHKSRIQFPNVLLP